MQHEIAISMALSHMLANNSLDTSNAVVLLKQIVERLEDQLPKVKKDEKVKYVVHFLSEIAKGKDGVAGTADDIIPPKIIQEIQKMTETDLVTDIINLCMDVAQRKKVNPMKVSLCCLKAF
tara:strand:+ start:22980 stop:23342 length:363 start_codon:yes stop_codon:yes gene_type:complete